MQHWLVVATWTLMPPASASRKHSFSTHCSTLHPHKLLLHNRGYYYHDLQPAPRPSSLDPSVVSPSSSRQCCYKGNYCGNDGSAACACCPPPVDADVASSISAQISSSSSSSLRLYDVVLCPSVLVKKLHVTNEGANFLSKNKSGSVLSRCAWWNCKEIPTPKSRRAYGRRDYDWQRSFFFSLRYFLQPWRTIPLILVPRTR